MSNNDRYNVVKFYKEQGKKPRVVMYSLTLEEAQKHCRREDTHGEDWFDEYTRDT
jgi:hypothetical protein